MHSPFRRQTDDDLLNPRWAECLSEICITDYPPEKIELVTADFVELLSCLDQCFDLRQKGAIGGHYAAPQAGDGDLDIYPIRIVLAWMRMAGMSEVME
jgi:hypothetical protein